MPNSKFSSSLAPPCPLPILFKLTVRDCSYDVTSSDIAAGATIIFNVNGAAFPSLGNFAMSGFDAQFALWNFFEATSITFANVAWEGSVLAPNADILGAQGVRVT